MNTKIIISLASIIGAGFLFHLALTPVSVPVSASASASASAPAPAPAPAPEKPKTERKVTYTQLPEMKVVGVIPTQISDLPKAEAGMIKRQTSKRQSASCEHNKTWAVGFEGDPEEPDNFRMVRLLCK